MSFAHSKFCKAKLVEPKNLQKGIYKTVGGRSAPYGCKIITVRELSFPTKIKQNENAPIDRWELVLSRGKIIFHNVGAIHESPAYYKIILKARALLSSPMRTHAFVSIK